MRLGVGLNLETDDPAEMALAYRRAGYSAAVCPRVSLEEPERMRLIREAFRKQDVILAEVGVWNNMLDANEEKRRANLEANIRGLATADEMGALCCVNIAGSYHPTCWDGPHPRNLSQEAFEATVENVRMIIDAVHPRRARYTIEGMPWAIPDSPESYLELIQAVDRPAFAVHLDPVNWISSPALFFDNASLLRRCFALLGPWIISCHAKDIRLREELTVHLEEVRPGLGELDYRVFLHEMRRLPEDTPLILEHLRQEEYPAARDYVLGIAEELS